MTRSLLVVASLLLAGCTTESEITEAVKGYCIRNQGLLECEDGVCPCATELGGTDFTCVQGYCQRSDSDGGACIYTKSFARERGYACGCDSDCTKRECGDDHLCR